MKSEYSIQFPSVLRTIPIYFFTWSLLRTLPLSKFRTLALSLHLSKEWPIFSANEGISNCDMFVIEKNFKHDLLVSWLQAGTQGNNMVIILTNF